MGYVLVHRLALHACRAGFDSPVLHVLGAGEGSGAEKRMPG